MLGVHRMGLFTSKGAKKKKKSAPPSPKHTLEGYCTAALRASDFAKALDWGHWKCKAIFICDASEHKWIQPDSQIRDKHQEASLPRVQSQLQMFFFVQIVVCLCCVQSVAPAGCTGGSCYFIACGSSGLLVCMSFLFRITMEKHFLKLPG